MCRPGLDCHLEAGPLRISVFDQIRCASHFSSEGEGGMDAAIYRLVGAFTYSREHALIFSIPPMESSDSSPSLRISLFHLEASISGRAICFGNTATNIESSIRLFARSTPCKFTIGLLFKS